MHDLAIDRNRRTTIAAEASDLFDELVTIRRDLHAHPEIGHQEFRTTQVIIDRLAAAGLTATALPVGTGALCDILPASWKPGQRLVGLRADIDALPITDTKTVDYASTNPGACHACGHDVHTTVVIGVGLLLARLRDRGELEHGVRLIFQPAEESSPGGAVEAIDGGACVGLTEVYALHCDPRTDAGQLAIKVGPITSAVDRVNITLTGTGGHTSRPHLTQDLVGALGQLATTTQLILSRRVDPRSGVSLMWGRIAAGSAANAIPQSGQIEGTLRALDVNGWYAAKKLLPEIAAEIVRPFGIDISVEVTEGVPPAVNHPYGVARLSEAAEAMLGAEGVTVTEQSLGGEDFAWMLQQVRGAMARLGVRPPGQETAPDIHQSTFNVDERCIEVGVKVLAELATSSHITIG